LIQKEGAHSADKKAVNDREGAVARKAEDPSTRNTDLKKHEAAVARKANDQADV
jgi:hypothetical protein